MTAIGSNPTADEGQYAAGGLPPGWPVLVTGAGGFVGGHVARRLAEAG